MIATHYEGDPPDDATEWWDWMTEKKGTKFMEGHKYTCFGLGDLTYKHFCKMGKDTDEILKTFGSEEFFNFGTGTNDQNNIEEDFDEWKIGIWPKLLDVVSKNPEYDPNATATVGTGMKYQVEVLDSGDISNVDQLNFEEYDLNAGVKNPLIFFFRNSSRRDMEKF